LFFPNKWPSLNAIATIGVPSNIYVHVADPRSPVGLLKVTPSARLLTAENSINDSAPKVVTARRDNIPNLDMILHL
jgi:hypothetical protein